MASPKIRTYREVIPLIYSWTTPDMPKYEGWEKIGYTEQESAKKRIRQQGSQTSMVKNLKWERRAFYTSAAGGTFTDRDFHRFLRQVGVERELVPLTEWHKFSDAAKTSLEYFNDFAGQNLSDLQTDGDELYVLRPEQQEAVVQAITAFNDGHSEVLWNAKPRFGKTLTTYDLMRTIDAKKVLIVTNRPAIANSWFDDFIKFIGHQTTYKFVSESASLESRSPMTREQWRKQEMSDEDDPRIVEFLSLQDLKGSRYFGGPLPKLKHIADFDWDLLVIDEAHEGIDTLKTHVAFDQIKRDRTLHLSGTPFKALAKGDFSDEQIFNWTYEDEQSARESWDDPEVENPYAALPTLNMLTYQVSRMLVDRLAEGAAIDDDDGNIDYTFNLNEFFATKPSGFFEHETEVLKFLDCLTTNEKYPFSTPELRDEIRHSFWLLDRVDSARALQKILNKHDVFKDYTIVLAAGDGRTVDADPVGSLKSLDKVRAAIKQEEKDGGKTITLSVGQLTTGVTVPEWTAVIMLSNVTSPALYMQAAFRAQNPCMFERNGAVFQKENAYIFDFAPERTLTIFDAFANNLSNNQSGEPRVRQENIKRLLNFFPVIGEDSDGHMVELDAVQVLTFPKVYKAREVVRRGFLSNLLFDNVAGIFRHSEAVRDILEKLPTAQQGKIRRGQDLDLPVPPPTFDSDGNVTVDAETVINPKVEGLGKPVWSLEDLAEIDLATPNSQTAREIGKLVTEKARETRSQLQEEYGLSNKQIERDERQTAAQVQADIERALSENDIARARFDDEIKDAATEVEVTEAEARRAEHDQAFQENILNIVNARTGAIATEVVTREETKAVQREVNRTQDDVRAHLRGFARTIPMFLMAYGDRGICLANFDDYTPDEVFEEITGITEAEFRVLRDGREEVDETGESVKTEGFFDETVFDQSIQEFLDKKEALADYFDESQTEDIFAYIPQQKTSLVFTPQSVSELMVDILVTEDSGIFEDSTKSFADLFSTAGLFLMELVRRLDKGLSKQIPDQKQRLEHIFSHQIFEMSHNELLHKITIEAVSGGVPERREWLANSGHFVVGNLALMSADERQKVVNGMLGERGGSVSQKFDVIVGNPPYQDEASGSGTRDTPVYHLFMDAAYDVCKIAVLVTPARFLFNAGLTPKAWNMKMLSSEHLEVAKYFPHSGELFPGTDIKGGSAVTYFDVDRIVEPIGTFMKSPDLDKILRKVQEVDNSSIDQIISSGRSYAYTTKMHDENPRASSLMSTDAQFRVSTNTFDQLDFLFLKSAPKNHGEYSQVLGLIKNRRVSRWIRSEYIAGPDSFDAYKVVLPAANGSGRLGELLSSPRVIEPGVAVTQTFITVGCFADKIEAEACLKYVKSKFARTMLGVLKTTQHNPAKVWKHVPLQDFTSESDIDWSKSIPEIDQQLYKKYKLDKDEIEFVESHVKPMD